MPYEGESVDVRYEQTFRGAMAVAALYCGGVAISVADHHNYPLAIFAAVLGLVLWLGALADSLGGMFDD